MSVNEQQNIMKNTVLNSEKQSTSMPLQNNKKLTFTTQHNGVEFFLKEYFHYVFTRYLCNIPTQYFKI